MQPEERATRQLTRLSQALRDMQNNVHVSQTSWMVPGRKPNASVDTRRAWHELEALRRAVYEMISDKENKMKPLRFGSVTPTAPPHHGRVGPSIMELSRWGIVETETLEDGSMRWRANLDCEINGKWYAPGGEIEWGE